MDAIGKRDDAKHELELLKRKDELEKRSFYKKALDTARLGIGTMKAINAGIDDSVTFVQLVLAVMANPGKAVSAKWEALKSINAKYFNRTMTQLHESPMWDIIKRSELDITEPKSLMEAKKEELYANNLLDKEIKIGNKKVNLWTNTGGIFERIFTMMGNSLRLKMFEAKVNELVAEGKTIDSHPEEYKSVARVINELTGRGKVHEKLTPAMDVITPIIWAPKMLASTINILGVNDIARAATANEGGFYRSLTKEQRKYAAAQLTRGIGMGAAVMTALALRGWKVDANPQSSSFGFVTAPDGNLRYNVFGRYAGFVKLLAQTGTGNAKTTEGNNIDLDKEGRVKTVGKFFRGKMTPFAGFIYDYTLNSQRNSFTKEKIEPFTKPLKTLDQLITPMSIKDLREGLKNDGTTALLTRFLPAFEGINVQDKRDFIDDLPKLIERNTDTEGIKKDGIYNYKDKRNTREINDSEFKQYLNKRTEKIKEGLTKMYNEGFPFKVDGETKIVPYKDMTRDQIVDATTYIKSQSTSEAKEELFGKKYKTSKEKKEDRKLKKQRSQF